MRGQAEQQRFTLSQPVETHFRPATCEEVDCPQQKFGWVICLDPTTQAAFITDILNSGRHFQKMRSEEASQRASRELPPGLLAFVFPPGQRCFRPHRVPVGRPPNLVHQKGLVLAGGAMGTFVGTSEKRVHTKAENFVEHYNEEADELRRRRQAG